MAKVVLDIKVHIQTWDVKDFTQAALKKRFPMTEFMCNINGVGCQ